jgi:hypothetical protein
MVGTWQVRVHAVRPFTIHGDQYYELQVTRSDGAAGDMGFIIRVPQHAMAGEPREGQRLELTFLMGQVTAAKAME